MPELLLLNPKRRRGAGRKRRKTPSAAQRRARAAFAAMSRARSRVGRSANPKRRRRATAKRRRNPISYRSAARRVSYRRRRRNPSLRSIGGSVMNFRSYIPVLKDAAVMGAGAIAIDYAFSFINQYLPASMRKVSGKVGAGDAVKALLTVALGFAASSATKGLSKRAAMGSLVVQMRDLMLTLVPAAAAPVNGLGFVTAGRVVPGMTGRVNSNMRASAMSPLLSQWIGGRSNSPLLSGPGMGMIYPTSTSNVRTPLRRV